MAKHKKHQEPSAKVASVVPSKVDMPEAIAVDVVVVPEPEFFKITVDGLWMTCFHPLTTSDQESQAKKLDYASAKGFARHIEFRKKGKCEIMPY